MKKPAKKHRSTAATSATAPDAPPAVTEADGAPGKKQTNFLVAAGAAILCGATGAGAWFVAPTFLSQPHDAAANDDGAAHAPPSHKPTIKSDRGDEKKIVEDAKKKNGKKIDEASNADGAGAAGASSFITRGDVGVFLPRPIVVSLSPQSRVRYLKVILAIETTPDSEPAFMDNELRIIDALGGYLRAVPVDALEDPSAMARIREQVARRVRFVVDPAPVHAVLITDFILS